MRLIDYSLYLVTDRDLSRGRPLIDVVGAAIQGGVTCVQLREKTCSTREFLTQAVSIKEFLKERGIPLIINDRIDIALVVQADGVHLGQSDMPLELAQRILPETMIVGISAESPEDAESAEKGGADYISVSPVFGTPTKTDTAPPLGIEGIREIRRRVKIPIVGIGGLNEINSADIIRAGADGIAVVSAIMAADNPEETARRLKQTIMQAKQNEAY